MAKIIGLWHRPFEENITEIHKTLKTCQNMGFNHLFIETFFQGKTIFKSKTIEHVHPFINDYEQFGPNLLLAFVQLAKAYHITIHAWVENFFIGVYQDKKDVPFINEHEDWALINDDGTIFQRNEKNYVFLDPANDDVIKMLISFYDELVTFGIHGLHLDYIRYPLSNQNSADHRLDDNGHTFLAIERFKKLHQMNNFNIEMLMNDSNVREKWFAYKRNIISSFVKTIYNRYHNKVVISTAVFGDPNHALHTKMQDWLSWVKNQYIDIVMPMAYYKDVNKIILEVMQMKARLQNDTKIVIGIAPLYMGLSLEEQINQMKACLQLDVLGFACFASQNYLSKHFMGISNHEVIQKSMRQWLEEEEGQL